LKLKTKKKGATSDFSRGLRRSFPVYYEFQDKLKRERFSALEIFVLIVLILIFLGVFP